MLVKINLSQPETEIISPKKEKKCRTGGMYGILKRRETDTGFGLYLLEITNQD